MLPQLTKPMKDALRIVYFHLKIIKIDDRIADLSFDYSQTKKEFSKTFVEMSHYRKAENIHQPRLQHEIAHLLHQLGL